MALPALARLGESLSASLSLACRGANIPLARRLGLFREVLSVDSARFAVLFAENPEPSDLSWLSFFDRILYLGHSDRAAQNLCSVNPRTLRVPPRPPADQPVSVSRHLWEGLVAGAWVRGAPPSGNGFAQWKPPGKGAPVLIHPGAGSPRKRWPLGNFLSLARELEKRGIDTVFLLGPAESELGDGLSGKAVVTPEDTARLWDLLLTVRAFIGNDAGPAHLAGLAGVPTTLLFGPSDPVRWTPQGPRVMVIRPALDCPPCFETKEAKCEEAPPCLSLPVETVLTAILKRLGQ